MTKYNTMFDVAFSVEHECDNPEDVPVTELLDGMQRRLDDLRNHTSDAMESFGVCDTYVVE